MLKQIILSYFKIFQNHRIIDLQNYNINNQMRSKQRLSRLIKQFLKTSPRSIAQKRNSILPPQHRQPLSRLPTDEQYVKNFIVHINCSYMYNYYGPLTINQHKMYLHKKSFVNPLSAGLVRRKAIEINDKTIDKKQILFELIKILNKDKQTILRYVEIQQFLSSLSTQQFRSYKKVIVFLYKWVLTQKHTFDTKSIHHQLCHDLSTLIIKRIYESHENGDYQLMKNTEEEILTIENLEKARELRKVGKDNEAKELYEVVYFGRVIDQNDRQEALQYIRDKCREERDITTLQRIIKKINQGQGIKIHQKSLARTINEIHELQKPQPESASPFLVQDLLINNNNNPKIYPQSLTEEQTITQGRRTVGRRIKYYESNARQEDCEDLPSGK